MVQTSDEAGRCLSPRRKWCILAAATLLVVLHALCIWNARGFWPVVRYEMYRALPQSDEIVKLRLVGVTDEANHYGVDAAGEIRLSASEHLPPFDSLRLSNVMSQLGIYRDSPDTLAAALNNLAFIYEKARRRGDHHGPKLRALRLYQVVWKLDEQASNVDTPNQKRLLVEANIDA